MKKELLIGLVALSTFSAFADIVPDRTVLIGQINEVTMLPLKKGIFVRGRVIDNRPDVKEEELKKAERISVRLPKSCHELAVTAISSNKNVGRSEKISAMSLLS